MSNNREVDFDGVKAVYREQIDALLDGGASLPARLLLIDDG